MNIRSVQEKKVTRMRILLTQHFIEDATELDSKEQIRIEAAVGFSFRGGALTPVQRMRIEDVIDEERDFRTFVERFADPQIKQPDVLLVFRLAPVIGINSFVGRG